MTAQQQPILEGRGLSKRFGGHQALNNVSFQLYPGEVLALAGDNGAGKSTLIKCISGAHLPNEGQIFMDGKQVHITNPQESRAAGIETIYQDLALAENLDVGANVFLGREPITKVFGIFPVINRKMMRSSSAQVLDTLEIHTRLDKPVGDLSGGQKQAVAIGRAIEFFGDRISAFGFDKEHKIIRFRFGTSANAKGQSVGISRTTDLFDAFITKPRVNDGLHLYGIGERG